MKILLFLVCFTSFLYAEFQQTIKPLRLFSGKTDTVHLRDIYYLESENIKIHPDTNLTMDYSEKESILIITPKKGYSGLTYFDIEQKGRSYTVPVFVKELTDIKFRYKNDSPKDKIFLFGSFNNWNRQSHPLTYREDSGYHEITMGLEPGIYEYKFFIHGKELVDPENPEKTPNPFGAFNSVLTVKKKVKIPLGLFFSHSYETDSIAYYYYFLSIPEEVKGFNKDNVFAWVNNKRLDNSRVSIKKDTLILSIPLSEKKGWLKTALTIKNSYTYFKGAPLTPSSWHNSIIYSIMIDRFNNGDKTNDNPIENEQLAKKVNYLGGDFKGIHKKIQEGYFNKLGISALWLSPVNDNPNHAEREFPPPHRYFSGYHGYWPIHHERVEEHFGDMDELKALINNAHGRNIKVVLDFIANHTHKNHPFYRNNPQWFGKLELPNGKKNIRFWDEYRLTTWFEPFLPSFDYLGSPEALEAMTDNAVYWLKETGADGFRHDAVKHVPNLFWRSLTEKLVREIMIPRDETVYQIGETFGDYQLISSYVNNGQLSSQFNFNIYDRAKPVFLDPESDFSLLSDEMMKTVSVYGHHHLMGNIMDSHDKIRYMAYCDGDITSENEKNSSSIAWENPPQVDSPKSYDKVLLYQAFQMSIPGVPIVYYGDEIAMTGSSDPDNRRMMIFDEERNELQEKHFQRFSKLIKIRNEHKALQYGDFIPVEADKNIFAFLRTTFSEKILVLLNKSSEKQTGALTLPSCYANYHYEDLNVEKTSKLSEGKLSYQINPYGFSFYVLKK